MLVLPLLARCRQGLVGTGDLDTIHSHGILVRMVEPSPPGWPVHS